jgi:alginate O-acetyltransferase complex protein AlgI
MLFTSYKFLIFLPTVFAIYYLIPRKTRHLWLLAVSYFFYMCWDVKYALLLFTSTVSTYLAGIALEKIKNNRMSETDKKKRQKRCMTAVLVLNLGILFGFKYAGFTLDNIVSVTGWLGITYARPELKIILPVGISFYTFQALGYMIDVYRDKISAEKNFFRYALFISFFPLVLAGPIERAGNLLKQLREPHDTTFAQVKDGVLLMLWGFFLKIVLADRIGIFVDSVFGKTQEYSGAYQLAAVVLFALQIYCDFCGYSTIAVGTAELFGLSLTQNFDSPYMSQDPSEFWRRWHISLSGWFRDYVYIPLGGNRKGKARKYLNVLITMGLSGLWHGADWSFVVWGLINGFYQVIDSLISPLKKKMAHIPGINPDSASNKALKMLVTFVIIDFAWIFFRASDCAQAMDVIRSIVTVRNIRVLATGGLYSCGLDMKNFKLMMAGIALLAVSEYMQL